MDPEAGPGPVAAPVSDPVPGPAPDASAEEPADALAGVQRLIRRRLRAGPTVARLRGAEAELLRLVESRPGIGVSEAAEELHLAGDSVSTLVDRPAADGRLVRETDPAGRRAVRLLLTEAAGARLRDWRPRRAALVRTQVDRPAPADRDALRAAVPAPRRPAGNLREDADRP
nr:hypothetical protein StreXyl84_58790 [Streptomyces sp. Xyl84]